jgi:hypothetical protein
MDGTSSVLGLLGVTDKRIYSVFVLCASEIPSCDCACKNTVLVNSFELQDMRMLKCSSQAQHFKCRISDLCLMWSGLFWKCYHVHCYVCFTLAALHTVGITVLHSALLCWPMHI